ncbi:MAG TPA: (Fe-S)-binding protein [Thermoanaerobaculia bacterium]|nr:(Fe-S)-binding protein [Thermoanaerobaculia bacterium]
MAERREESRPRAVYFYGTCLVDLFFPAAGMAGIELLRREGLEVVFPQGQTCCGQPPFNCGHSAAALAVARAQIALFPQPWPVVVPSGSCAAMMKRHYPELFAGEPDHPAAEAFAARVYELTQFLVGVLGVQLDDKSQRSQRSKASQLGQREQRGQRGQGGQPVRVTWHSSCHALRELGVREEPLALLGQLANVELAPLARERECCGFGGTFSIRFPEISAAMVADKAADVTATGASELLSGDCGCLLNIAGHLARQGSPVRARHIAEFLLERTGGD